MDYDVHIDGWRKDNPVSEELQRTLAKLAVDPERLNIKGFLGLSISGNEAADLCKRLRREHIVATAIPIHYRDLSPLPIDACQKLAEAQMAIHRIEIPDLAQVFFAGEFSMFYVFASASQILNERGTTPAALFVSVDKLDGHIWMTTAEIHEATYGTFP